METLHPDLIPHVVDGMIHHRLLVQLVPEDAAYINQLYRQKTEKLRKAEADGDWSKFILLHERPYQLDALRAATKKGLGDNPEDYWALVADVWLGSENIFQNLSDWKLLWGTAIEGRRACMSAKDVRMFDALPEIIEVWRGTNHKRHVNGLSWTLDQAKAAWFARRFRSKPHVPLIVKGTVSKGDVLAFFGERNEREIVSMRVSIISVTQMDRVSSDQ